MTCGSPPGIIRKEAVHKRRPNSGGRVVYSKFMVCPHGQGGIEPVRTFYRQGGGVNFSQFCTDVFYGQLITILLSARIVTSQRPFVNFKHHFYIFVWVDFVSSDAEYCCLKPVHSVIVESR